MKINLNDTIKVKLTDYGRDIYYHQYDCLDGIVANNPRKYPEVDENGYTRMQLWCFMELYGHYISMTQPKVIDPIEIIIEEE